MRRRETTRWAAGGCGLGLLVVGLGIVLIAAVALPFEGCDLEFGLSDACTDADDGLIAAASSGDTDELRERLADGSEPNRPTEGVTSLSCAVANHHADAVVALLEAGAIPTTQHLVDATYSGDTAIARSLLDAGAPVETRVLTAAAGDGGTSHRPFSDAPVKAGTPDELLAIATLALERGADPNRATEGPTPLLFAAYNGRESMVALLIAHGADPNLGGQVGADLVRFAQLATPNSDLYPPLSGPMVANVPPIVAATWIGQLAISTRLLDAGADPNLAADEAFTSLYAASLRGDELTVELLLARGADPVPVVRPGVMTPAEVARAANHPHIAQLLDAHQ
jgi:ankyrin repeat protein